MNLQVDGNGGNAFIGSCELPRFCVNLPADLIKVCELLPLAVEKFPIFWKEEEQRQVMLNTICKVFWNEHGSEYQNSNRLCIVFFFSC